MIRVGGASRFHACVGGSGVRGLRMALHGRAGAEVEAGVIEASHIWTGAGGGKGGWSR
jgi:hypothetical protein